MRPSLRAARAALASLLIAGPAAADPAALAAEAAAALGRAAEGLSAADGTGEHLAALTATVAAYEEGLAALREALRQGAAREHGIRSVFEAEEARLSRLLGVLMSMGSREETTLLLHPGGPLDTIRAGMVAADITPALASEVADLRADLEEMAILTALRESAVAQLEAGLSGVTRARAALARAARERRATDESATDGAAMQALVEAADTLQGFADTLMRPGAMPEAPPPEALPLPVRGRVLRRAGEADAAGVARPGIVLATAPRALVTAPAAATVRYAGPLLDDPGVAVLELAPGRLLILAGMAAVFPGRGAILAPGDPVGLMGGEAADARRILIAATDGHGQSRPESLYIEARQGNRPVDPSEWFDTANEVSEP